MTRPGLEPPAVRDGLPAAAHAVLDFWLGDALDLGWPSQSRSSLWFGGGTALDRDIRQRFGALVREAVAGGLVHWETVRSARIALVLLLDQFTRNVFRGEASAFSGDARAQALVLQGPVGPVDDASQPLAGRVFLCMPLMHAEDLALQDECVRRFRSLRDSAAPVHQPHLQDHLDSALEHRDIIARFGRFPYRNRVLGRANTLAEQQFLLGGKRFGQ